MSQKDDLFAEKQREVGRMTVRMVAEALWPEHGWHTITKQLFSVPYKRAYLCDCGDVLQCNLSQLTDEYKEGLRNVEPPTPDEGVL